MSRFLGPSLFCVPPDLVGWCPYLHVYCHETLIKKHSRLPNTYTLLSIKDASYDRTINKKSIH